MAELNNFLLGHGERLASRIPPATGPVEKVHPYSFDEARERILPRIRKVVEELDALPASVCPRDSVVALMTLHPAYIAKSYYPNTLLQAGGVEAVGSKTREIVPEKSTKKGEKVKVKTSDIFIAGTRATFRRFAKDLATWTEKSDAALDLRKLEDIRAIPLSEKIKPIRSDKDELLLEVVLHAAALRKWRFVRDGFEQYLDSLEIASDFDKGFMAEGLCFLPIRTPKEKLNSIAQFSFLRVAREMPRIRQFRPILGSTAGTSFTCQLPTDHAIDSDLKVAIFDGGLASGLGLENWATPRDAGNLSAPVPEYVEHGTAVTSALLFGSFLNGSPASTPYCKVDHYRVLDSDTHKDDQAELYSVLARIKGVLSAEQYDFINLSIGPDLPIEDDDIHAWTAVLDSLLSKGESLAAIAAGNGGERDWLSGNARIQSPADCVNGLTVGACDTTGTAWARAPYSSVGPGRSPGVIKPDAVAFGGSQVDPFWVVDANKKGYCTDFAGTSFAAPSALRTALGIRAFFGEVLSPLALKCILIHNSEEGSHPKEEVGWGRIPQSIVKHVKSGDDEAHIVYQGELSPGKWLRVPIPVPAQAMKGFVTIAATFCFFTETDPQDPFNYTRAGLEIRFRPNETKRTDPKQMYADPQPFFQARDLYLSETELRTDAHKWETTLHREKRFRGGSLNNPVFDVHYNARLSGGPTTKGESLPYALVVTVRSAKTKDLYNQIVKRYRTQLEPLRPVLQIPIPL